MTIIDRIRGKKVKFIKYKNNELWYSCEDGFEFPVPISDTGTAEFKNEDGAMFFMRWIRKQMEFIDLAKSE
jgi:hypothetical protein